MLRVSIHDGHTSSVALMRDDKILYAIQEERLRKEKNVGGFPSGALEDTLKNNGISLDDVDEFVFAGNTAAYKMKTRGDVLNKYSNFFKEENFISLKKSLRHLKKEFLSVDEKSVKENYIKKEKNIRRSFLEKLGIPGEKIFFVEHHHCHASAAVYGSGMKDCVVVTSDSSGDGISGTVSIVSNGHIKRLASIDIGDSIGRLYSLVTYYMGMVPMEHEYKIMGMAPFAEGASQSRDIADYFHSLFEFPESSPLIYKRRKQVEPVYEFGSRLTEYLKFKRFDHICSGIQLFVQEFVTKWIRNILKDTGQRNVCLGGGLFMNVKLNQMIAELNEVNDVYIFPSCSDESNVFGALYSRYFEKNNEPPKKLEDYYLGGEFDDNLIESSFENYDFKNHKVTISYWDEIEKKVAQLLSDDKVVARFNGRMEFGARSLGNRSILANPANHDAVKIINNMIKKRDFWMPFAPSMINSEKYIVNPKRIKAPYMILTFQARQDKISSMIGAGQQ
jgi:carbamoyltransferase